MIWALGAGRVAPFAQPFQGVGRPKSAPFAGRRALHTTAQFRRTPYSAGAEPEP